MTKEKKKSSFLGKGHNNSWISRESKDKNYKQTMIQKKKKGKWKDAESRKARN